jgi:hypothetical protein
MLKGEAHKALPSNIIQGLKISAGTNALAYFIGALVKTKKVWHLLPLRRDGQVNDGHVGFLESNDGWMFETTLSITTFSITTLSIRALYHYAGFVMLRVVFAQIQLTRMTLDQTTLFKQCLFKKTFIWVIFVRTVFYEISNNT